MEENTYSDIEIFAVDAVDQDISPQNQVTKVDVVGCRITNGAFIGKDAPSLVKSKSQCYGCIIN